MDTSYAVFCGIDVGKSEHHAVGLAVDGTRLYDKALPNDEDRLRAVFDRLATHGPLLIVVDQPNTIGALPVTVARSCGHQVAYLPGLSMRRIADLYPGQAKTDARDAFIIADTARTMPHTLRRVDTGDDTLAELDVLIGFDDDLAGEATRISNRIRGCRDCSAQTGGLAQRDTATKKNNRCGRREDARCPPSFLGPDLDARHRNQDSSTHPPRSR